jgi:N-acetylglucosamine kinase-like BadF-type ATPase
MVRVLGIDGGATKTHAIIMDDTGAVLGEGFGGVGNYTVVGADGAQQSFADAVAAARAAAGLDNTPFDAAFLGLASVVSETDHNIIRRIAAALKLAAPENVGVDHDCSIALAGGLSGRPGIVQICGTGSSTFAMNAAGEGWRVGGWGRTISDEGSAYWMGVEAMRAAVRAYDGRDPETVLVDEVLDFLQIPHMDYIYQPLYVQGLSKTEIARMAPRVINAAAAGDATAQEIIHTGMAMVAECVEAAARKVGLLGAPIELALVGGVFSAGEITVGALRDAVNARMAGCTLVWPELAPVAGAGILALRMAGVELGEASLRMLRRQQA